MKRHILVLAVLACSVGTARAETSEQVRADALFREGMQKFDTGEIAAACAAFTESLRLDPKLGTLLNLALCHEREGKTATAWLEFSHGAAWATQVGQRDRREFANQHTITLESQLSRVLLHLPPAGVLSTVEVDGEPLPEPRWYLPLYLDPGEHTVAVTAPGKARWRTRVSVPREPTAQIVPIPPLEDVKPSAPPPPKPPAPTSPPPSNTQKIVGFALGGLGLVGVGAGAALGVMTISKRDDMTSHCVGTQCDPVGAQAHDDAQKLAAFSTVAFVVGTVSLATGVVLLLTAPRRPDSPTARAFLGPRSAGISGTF